MIAPYYATDSTTLYMGNCLDIHPLIQSQSVDLILTDLPYGVTACDWDVKLPLDQLWGEWKRIIKPKGAIALFGVQPFTSELVMSNPKWFKYEWVWEKHQATGHLDARRRPMRCHENVLIFACKNTVYNPVFRDKPISDIRRTNKKRTNNGCYGRFKEDTPPTVAADVGYPKSVIKLPAVNPLNTQHPTQKPIALLQYLIRTYTNEGDTVLDSTCGSGSTLVAAQSINRKSIGIELDADYCAIAASRLGSIEPELLRKESAESGQFTIFDIQGGAA